MVRQVSAVPLFVLCLSLLLASAGCARGGEVWMRGNDGGQPDGGRSDGGRPDESDGGAEVCDPPCEAGETCSAGSCVPSTDGDGDGLDSSVDCDDTDPSIGRTAERPCDGSCGPGLETCEDGVWGACSAPTSCDCAPGEPPRTLPCGACGTQRQTCVDGTWQNDGACMGEGACSPGDIDTGGSCGNCGTQRRTCDATCSWGAWTCEGTGVCAPGSVDQDMRACSGCGGSGIQVRERTCTASCSWGTWGSYGACSTGGGGECTAGAEQTRTVACGNCGTQMQRRTCGVGCTWGSWTNVGSCTGQGVCAPGNTTACDPADSCGQRVCTASCTWSACQPRVPGGCLRRRSPSQPEGSNYQCCPRGGGDQGWQFCLSTCQWSTACDATTSC